MVNVEMFYDNVTSTLTYLVWDSESNQALLIDPVWDFDSQNITLSYRSIEDVLKVVQSKKLDLTMILETHVHADHLTGAGVIKKIMSSVPVGISRRVCEVQKIFRDKLNFPKEFLTDGSQFDLLFDDQQVLKLGAHEVKVIATPGHTPACTSFLVGETKLFVGDSIFMPDFGTGRCDFPGGSAKILFESIQKLFSLPDSVDVYVGHDYQPGGRKLKYRCTIADQKLGNIHVKADTTEEEFIKFRTERDATLKLPKLLYQSLGVNLQAGKLPGEPGARFFQLPIVEPEDPSVILKTIQ